MLNTQMCCSTLVKHPDLAGLKLNSHQISTNLLFTSLTILDTAVYTVYYKPRYCRSDSWQICSAVPPIGSLPLTFHPSLFLKNHASLLKHSEQCRASCDFLVTMNVQWLMQQPIGLFLKIAETRRQICHRKEHAKNII